MTGQEMTTDQGTARTVDSGFFLEIACFDMKSLLLADSAGADRTEFCADRESGGVTPPLTEILTIVSLDKNPVYVMIRPRGGNFVYSDLEFEQMKHDILMAKSMSEESMQVQTTQARSLQVFQLGFVFGILDATNEVDVPRNFELVALAQPLPCTFHRAFDETTDLDKSLEDVIACGFTTILTSGGAADAVSGTEALRRLVQKAKGRVTIMPGGGVRSSNIESLKEKAKANWYHSSAVVGNEINIEEVRLLRRSL
jgi:copper homeostasis protein